MPHTIEIVDDLMTVLDEDGNGCDAHELRSLCAAKRQLRRWQQEYTFDYADALSAVSTSLRTLSNPRFFFPEGVPR